MSSSQEQQDPLRPVLEETEAELAQHLETTRQRTPDDVSTESEDDLRELEDSLLAAAVSVQQTISLRRHVERRKAAVAKQREAAAEQDREERRRESVAVREFQDQSGRPWRAWSVTPGLRPGRDAKRYLGDYHGGWLCFEALDGSARKRLPRYPSDWLDLTEPALDRLLGDAINAPERRASKANPDEPRPSEPDEQRVDR
jgi:hypothetical protein